MNNLNRLYLQKEGGSVVDTYQQWGIACCKVPFKAGGNVKSLAKRSWYDEHGEDTFFPSQSYFEAYDVEFECAYVGQELATNPFDLSLAFQAIDAFKKWCTGNDTQQGSGVALKVYSPFAGIGRQGCYLMSVSDEEPHVQLKRENGNEYNENVCTFKVKMRVTDPITDIILTP